MLFLQKKKSNKKRSKRIKEKKNGSQLWKNVQFALRHWKDGCKKTNSECKKCFHSQKMPLDLRRKVVRNLNFLCLLFEMKNQSKFEPRVFFNLFTKKNVTALNFLILITKHKIKNFLKTNLSSF